MTPRSGLLLEHFARLAANVAGTSAAIVGVQGRRSDRNPTLASYGLPQERPTAIQEIDRILHAQPGLITVPDLTKDARFSAQCRLPDLAGMHFMAHLKLLSAGGERIGFIAVLDRAPRDGLTEAQIASLGDIASMIMADRRREQRHLHLMHVADRALRVDRLLRLVSEAASCASALTNLLEELCRFHGAAIGRIWQLIQANDPLHEISRFDEEDRLGDGARFLASMTQLSTAAAGAVRFNKAQASKFPTTESSASGGLTAQVCVPIWVQQQRFGISLGFTTERSDLDAVTADIASLADTIRPALFRKVTEERIRFLAHHDALTQLANRVMFQERLRVAMAAAQSGSTGFALLYLDLDGFKLVNDTHGHETGDHLLVAVAQRLRDNLREGDTVARMGGDEFAIIQSTGHQPAGAISLAQRLIAAVGQPFELKGQRSVIGTSVGVAFYPQDGDDPDALLRNADIALYRAKEAGRNTFRLFEAAMQVRQEERFLMEQDLREAIQQRQFSLVYQPVCDIASLQARGFEALLRWNHPTREWIEPEHFIQVAESSGQIMPLGRWALETACMDAAGWGRPVWLSVNCSPLQFRQPDFPEQVTEVLRRTGLPAERLDLEVTEGVLLDESDLVLATTHRLRELGIGITLDDFGTAYASLSYLRRFPFTRMKIDQSFVRGLGEDDGTIAIVRAILSLGEQLGVTVVAEGVETERELAILRDLGCRLIQGYYSGRAMAGDRVQATLRPKTFAAPDGN
ncbi:MAG TPA: EAL domain-containing protein [Acetobacteraceae bacterium]|nr:EAL domain-containing protein [Acetobacteraceae bacterium]